MMSSIGDLQKYHQFNAILARKTYKTFVLQILNHKYANSYIYPSVNTIKTLQS